MTFILMIYYEIRAERSLTKLRMAALKNNRRAAAAQKEKYEKIRKRIAELEEQYYGI